MDKLLQLEHNSTMFQSEHSTTMFQPEHNADPPAMEKATPRPKARVAPETRSRKPEAAYRPT